MLQIADRISERRTNDTRTQNQRRGLKGARGLSQDREYSPGRLMYTLVLENKHSLYVCTLGPTQPLVQMGIGGKARPGRDADRSSLSDAVIVNEYELYFLSPLRLHRCVVGLLYLRVCNVIR
jgi:hypothetical protein